MGIMKDGADSIMGGENTVTVYVAAHKHVVLNVPDCYQKIAVGPLAAQKLGADYVKDSTGDNISEKNSNYCELTAHYWIWKNDQSDIVGLCHYRRFLTKKWFSNDVKYIIGQGEIEKALNGGADIILPYRPVARRTVKDIYLDFGYEKDWNILKDCLAEKYPEYVQEFEELEKRHSNYPQNILICRKEIFDRYSEWLFDILFEVEKRVDLSGYDTQSARIFGYMSERLLEVWVRKNKLKIKHFRILKTEQQYSLKQRMFDMLGIFLTRFKY